MKNLHFEVRKKSLFPRGTISRRVEFFSYFPMLIQIKVRAIVMDVESHGLHSLTVLDDETIERLINTDTRSNAA